MVTLLDTHVSLSEASHHDWLCPSCHDLNLPVRLEPALSLLWPFLPVRSRMLRQTLLCRRCRQTVYRMNRQFAASEASCLQPRMLYPRPAQESWAISLVASWTSASSLLTHVGQALLVHEVHRLWLAACKRTLSTSVMSCRNVSKLRLVKSALRKNALTSARCSAQAQTDTAGSARTCCQAALTVAIAALDVLLHVCHLCLQCSLQPQRRCESKLGASLDCT